VIAQMHGLSSLVVEGDSQLIIRALQKIMSGVSVDKVSKHWRLSYGISELGCLVKTLGAIVPELVRRKANSAADCMANLGVTMSKLHHLWRSRDPLPKGMNVLLNRCCRVDMTTWSKEQSWKFCSPKGMG
jgi:hypothetical protein